MLAKLATELDSYQAKHLMRQRPVLDSPQGRQVHVGDKVYLNFSSNDYLGLANHPHVKQAFINAAGKYGVGTGASHMISGHNRVHFMLEERLASFVGRDAALLFSTGYMANLGTIQAITSKQSIILQDKLNHASLIDGARLSDAKLVRYQHGSIESLNNKLKQYAATAEKLIVTDAIFSMGGDIAPLTEICQLNQQYQADLMVDDAHGFGVMGRKGRGTLASLGLGQAEVPVYVATLGKALGTSGAFVAGSKVLIDYLKQFARSYIYTTAMPAAIAAASLKSLELIERESWRQDKLNYLIQYFQKKAAQYELAVPMGHTAIQSITIGEPHLLMTIAKELRQKGLWLSAIRTPTVPKGSECLRITLSAEHETSDVNYLLETLANAISHSKRPSNED